MKTILFSLLLFSAIAVGQEIPQPTIDSLKRAGVNEFLADVQVKVIEAEKAIPSGDGIQVRINRIQQDFAIMLKEYAKQFKFK